MQVELFRVHKREPFLEPQGDCRLQFKRNRPGYIKLTDRLFDNYVN